VKKQTYIFLAILVISLGFGVHQYIVDENQQESITLQLGNSEEYDASENYYEDIDRNDLETYAISSIFGEPEEFVRDMRESGDCEYAYINETNTAIEMLLTPEQKKKWVEKVADNIQTVLDNDGADKMYEYTINDNRTEIDLLINGAGKGTSYAEDMVALVYNAELYQVFHGATDWSVHIVVTNMENGHEMVNINFPEEEFELTPDMWEE
jgi:hypothetical protein